MDLYLVLLHYPVKNRFGETVTTSVTNLDIHDIARTATTYGAKGYFIVTPIEDQQAIVNRILGHWHSEASLNWHPDRHQAVSQVKLMPDFNEVKREIEERSGKPPTVVLTSAKPHEKNVSYAEFRKKMKDQSPLCLVFGTGYGVSDEFNPEVHAVLDPVYGPRGQDGYNHLSVRSAAAIICDRLFGC